MIGGEVTGYDIGTECASSVDGSAGKGDSVELDDEQHEADAEGRHGCHVVLF